MWRTENWREESGALLRLAGPLIVNNLSIAGMQFADAVMAGRLGAESLAAVAVGGRNQWSSQPERSNCMR